MKLIRVQSNPNDNTGFFSNEFNEPITLEPNSTIALINGTFALNALNLDLQTSTIKFKTKDTNDLRTAIIPAAKYTQHSLLEVINKVMNNAVHYNGLANDTQFVWHASVHNHLLSLNFARGRQGGGSNSQPPTSRTSLMTGLAPLPPPAIPLASKPLPTVTPPSSQPPHRSRVGQPTAPTPSTT